MTKAKIDAGLRKTFHTNLAAMHWTAIETGGTASGVPDSNYCYNGIEGWCEYKRTNGWKVNLRTFQISWIQSHVRAGGRVWLAVRRVNQGGPKLGKPVDELWLISGRFVESVTDQGIDPRLINYPVYGRWHGGASNWDWEQIRTALTQGTI